MKRKNSGKRASAEPASRATGGQERCHESTGTPVRKPASVPRGRLQAAGAPSRGARPMTDFPETAEDSEFFVRMFKHEFDSDPRLRKPQPLADVAVVLTRDTWPSDDPEHGATMVANLLLTLAESPQRPKFLFLLNTAVKLAVKSSRTLESLQRLEALGTKIQVGKASLDHFCLEGELRVGEMISMLEMLNTCFGVGKVLTF
ncbi:MAG: hypothetical protein HY303_02525 [Candidatus Wallbacteria bacterium]|nr:hypothetical protein [Candidatus Wallbacteria bacterium]